MNIEQISRGYERSSLRLRLKLAVLLFLAHFLVTLMTQSALGQSLKTQLNAPGNATGTFPFGVNTSEAVVGSYVKYVWGYLGIFYMPMANIRRSITRAQKILPAPAGSTILTKSWAISWAPDNSYHGYTYIGEPICSTTWTRPWHRLRSSELTMPDTWLAAGSLWTHS